MTQVRKLLPADIASVVSYMMLPPAEYDAMCLHDAMKVIHLTPLVQVSHIHSLTFLLHVMARSFGHLVLGHLVLGHS